jgi:hypothetical protein
MEAVGGPGLVGLVVTGRSVDGVVPAREAMWEWEGMSPNPSVEYGVGREGNTTETLSAVCVQRAEVPTGIRFSGVDKSDLSHS